MDDVTHFATIGSTNDAAREAAAAGAPDGAAFVADEQTAGRGRGGNRWHSPPGENIYLSVLLRPSHSVTAWGALTLAIGAGVAEVVDDHLHEPRAMVKWPNDVYVDGRKLAGILVESTVQGDRPPVIIVGIGVNVLTASFPAELAQRATSLKVAGAEVDRERIAADLIQRVRAIGRRFADDGLAPWVEALRKRDFLRGKTVCVGETAGVAEGIDDGGHLIVGGTPCASGEVTIV